MKMDKGRIGMGLSLLAALLAVVFAPPPAADDGVVLATRKGASATAVAVPQSSKIAQSVAQSVDVLRIRPRDAEEGEDDGANVFASTQWTPPPPKVVAPPPSAAPLTPPAPQAPALPFKVLGRYVEDGKDVVFLLLNEQSLVVRVGDTIAGNYKVQSLNGGTLTLLYTPLNQQQTLDVGVLPSNPN
ncbi:hypothetical protein [Paraherbaspirillum soli]|uniref:Prolin-rich transmembrane protein n=1 Tax=Paraherbaspirillum soli TaxID=631222 RepID=A0ABW0M9U3_9BURK